jgi:hypothetical protein
VIGRFIRWAKSAAAHPEALMLTILGVCIAALLILSSLLIAIALGWLVIPAAI